MSSGSNLGILDNEYVLERILGSGGTSTIYLSEVQKTTPCRKFAIKILKNSLRPDQKAKYFKSEDIARTNLQSFLKESISKNKIENEKVLLNVVCPLKVEKGVLVQQDKKELVEYIVMDYIEKDELFSYILTKKKKGFKEKYAKAIFIKMINAIQTCHSAGFCHRDIKLENFLIDEEYNIKLCDFGFAASLTDTSKKEDIFWDPKKNLSTPCGTHGYKAPELYSKGIKFYNGVNADIFSLGVTIFSVIGAEFPFEVANICDSKYRDIIQRRFGTFWLKFKRRNSNFNNISNEFKDLFLQMVSNDPEYRPSISQILQHPWLSKNVASDEELIQEFKEREKEIKEAKSNVFNNINPQL